MPKPSVSLVKVWEVTEQSDLVQLAAGTAVFEYDYWRVTPRNGRPKYFYGEMAWADSRRYADDLEYELSKGGF